MTRKSAPLAVPLGVTAIAILIGGSYAHIHIAGLLSIAAGTAVIFPNTLSLSFRARILSGAILLIALASFLPSAWFEIPPWRTALANDANLTLPDTATTQPWVTLEGVTFLLGSLWWLSYLVTSDWSPRERRQLTHGLMALLTLLAGSATILQWKGIPWPSGEHAEQFSPFPNRNQLATLSAMSLVLHASGLLTELSAKRARYLLFLLVGLVIALLSLLVIGSRAGVVLGMFGVFAVLGVNSLRKRTWKPLGLALSVMLFLGAGLFLSDSRLIQRLSSDPRTMWTDMQNGRLAIYKDTLSQSETLPFFGHGLGNFPQVFPFYRDLSVSEFHLRHPESDLLWWWSELGWPVVGLMLLGILSLVRSPPRLSPRENERRYDFALRQGLLAAITVFALHAVVDVPGHRVGTLWVGILTLSLALPKAPRRSPIRFGRLLPIAVGGAACLVAVVSPKDSLTRSPLAWQGYYDRGKQTLQAGGSITDALADFQRARLLEPHSALVPLSESQLWWHHHPEYAFAAWREVLERDPERATEHFDRFLKQARQLDGNSWMRLRTLANDDPGLLAVFDALSPVH